MSFAALTTREQQILRAYPRLGVQKLIAHELGLHQQTVKTHASSILRKLGCVTLGQAAVLFDRWERPEEVQP